MNIFVYESDYEIDQGALFNIHQDPRVFQILTPPDLASLSSPHTRGIEPGSTAQIRMLIPGISKICPSLGFPWNVRHTILEPPVVFEDIQVSGPFKVWRHRHEFSSPRPGWTRITDRITWELPWFLRPGEPIVRRMLQSMFSYRERALQNYLASSPNSTGWS